MTDFTPIEGPLQLNKSDYLEAFRAVYARDKYRLVTGPCFILLAVFVAVTEHQTQTTILATVLAVGGFAIFYDAVRHLWAFPTALETRRRILGLAPLSYRIAADGLEMNTQVGSTVMRWPGFSGFIETPHLFVIIAKERAFYIIPKNAVPSGRLAELQSLLEAAIVSARRDAKP